MGEGPSGMVEDFKGKVLSANATTTSSSHLFHTFVGFKPTQTLKRSGDENVAAEIIQIRS